MNLSQWWFMEGSTTGRATESSQMSPNASSPGLHNTDSARPMATSSSSRPSSQTNISPQHQQPNPNNNKWPLSSWYFFFNSLFFIPVPEYRIPINTPLVLPGQPEPPHVLTRKIDFLYYKCPKSLEFIQRRMLKLQRELILESGGKGSSYADQDVYQRRFSKLVYREVNECLNRMSITGGGVELPREIPAIKNSPSPISRGRGSDGSTDLTANNLTRREIEEGIAIAEQYTRRQTIQAQNRSLSSTDTSFSQSNASGRFSDVTEIEFDRSDASSLSSHHTISGGAPEPQRPLECEQQLQQQRQRQQQKQQKQQQQQHQQQYQQQRNPEAQGSPSLYFPPQNNSNPARFEGGRRKNSDDGGDNYDSDIDSRISEPKSTTTAPALPTVPRPFVEPSTSTSAAPAGLPHFKMDNGFNFELDASALRHHQAANPTSRRFASPKPRRIIKSLQPLSVNSQAPQVIFGQASSQASAQPLAQARTFGERILQENSRISPQILSQSRMQPSRLQDSQENTRPNSQQYTKYAGAQPFNRQPSQDSTQSFSQPSAQEKQSFNRQSSQESTASNFQGSSYWSQQSTPTTTPSHSQQSSFNTKNRQSSELTLEALIEVSSTSSKNSSRKDKAGRGKTSELKERGRKKGAGPFWQGTVSTAQAPGFLQDLGQSSQESGQPSSKHPSLSSSYSSQQKKGKQRGPAPLQPAPNLINKENVRQQREFTLTPPILDDSPLPARPERRKKTSKIPSTQEIPKTPKREKGKKKEVQVKVEEENHYGNIDDGTLLYESESNSYFSSKRPVPSGIRPAFATPHRSKHSLNLNDTALWHDHYELPQPTESSQTLQEYNHRSIATDQDYGSLRGRDDTVDLAEAFERVDLDKDEDWSGLGMSYVPGELEGTDYPCNESYQSELLRQVKVVEKSLSEQMVPSSGPSKPRVPKKHMGPTAPMFASTNYNWNFNDTEHQYGKKAYPSPPLSHKAPLQSNQSQPSKALQTTRTLEELPFLLQWEATRAVLHAGLPPTNKTYNDIAGPYCEELLKSSRNSSRETWKVLRRMVSGITKDAKESSPIRTSITREVKNSFTNRTSDSLWENMKYGTWKNCGYLTGKFILNENGEKMPNMIGSTTRSDPTQLDKDCKVHQFLSVKLSPPSFMTGNRYFRRFGSDRFLFLSLPNLSEITNYKSGPLYSAYKNGSCKVDPEKFRRDICTWLAHTPGLEIANRLWVPYYIREKEESKGKANKMKVFQVILFAVSGVGIDNALGGSFETPGHERLTADQLLHWQIYLSRSRSQTVAKLWSRVTLALSTTTPTLTFTWDQIREKNDTYSDLNAKEVMDDGCCTISPAAMRLVAVRLGLDEMPTAIQGRIGGAKGVWFLDPRIPFDSKEIRICVNESQRKYKWHRDDEKDRSPDLSRLTLDVVSVNKARTPAKLNSQLIAILDAGGVPFEVLEELAREFIDVRLEEVEKALRSPVGLRDWIFRQGSLGQSRKRERLVGIWGGMPAFAQERIIMLLDAGFTTKTCPLLRELIGTALDCFVYMAKEKLHIEVPESTVVMCIADPTGTLEEGECWLALSEGLVNPNTQLREHNVVGEILVARNPALLPSDVQKVRAVEYNKDLRHLKDVIVFSTKGRCSLASKLSGGDYDGDKVWCTWDPRLVTAFQNSPVPTEEEVGYDKNMWFTTDTTPVSHFINSETGLNYTEFKFRGFLMATIESQLGMYTYHHSKCAYLYGLHDRRSKHLALVCSALVDAPKQGYSLKTNHEQILHGLVDLSSIRNLPYRDTKNTYEHERPQDGWINVLDRLSFDVVGNHLATRHAQLRAAITLSTDPEQDELDLDLIVPSQEFEEDITPVQKDMLSQLKQELDDIQTEWDSHWNVKNSTQWRPKPTMFRMAGGYQGSSQESSGYDDTGIEDSGFVELVDSLREKFLDIAPAPIYAQQDSLLKAYARRDKSGRLKNREWQEIKASFAYRRWKKYSEWNGEKKLRKLVWWVAGNELCRIKAAAGGNGAGSQVLRNGNADGEAGEGAMMGGEVGFGYRVVRENVFVSLRTMKDWEAVGLDGDGDGDEWEEAREFGEWE